MPAIHLSASINAPIERVFDLCRSIDLHARSMAGHGETPVAGVTRGLIGLDQEVTWRARHFGISQTLTSRITEYERPFHFRDSMVQGAFARFDHDHRFEIQGTRVLASEVFDFTSPMGLLGEIADALFLANYMEELLRQKLLVIKEVAESEQWKQFLFES